MAAWVLACLNCKIKFLHSKIGDHRLLDLLEPAKPDMPEQGVELECPSCGHRGVYRSTDLRYARNA